MNNFLKKLFAKFYAREKILKIVAQVMNRREEADINLVNEVLNKYDLGLSGERQDALVHDLHEAAEAIVLNKVGRVIDHFTVYKI